MTGDMVGVPSRRPERRSLEAPATPWLSPSRWVMLMLVLSVVTWRTRSVYSGGLDFVVVAKAALACLALALAWAARVSATRGRPMANTFVWFVLAYVIVSSFGAWTDGGLRVSGVLSARLLLVTFALVLLVKSFPREQLLGDLLACFALVAVVAAVTGLPSLATEGRLRGGIPQMHSNELSLLCALPALWLMHLVLRHEARPRHLVLLATLGAALLATGSRTAALTVVCAGLVMLVQARRLSPVLTVALVAAIPLVAWLSVRTDALEGFFARRGAGEGDITTLNSRSIVWEASLTYAETGWTRWFGSGLAVKRIPVEGQYWDVQNLDSSWVSALVQAGWAGAVLLAVWVLLLAGQTTRMPRGPRMLFQALLTTLFLRSILESGLVDSSPAFLTFIMLSLVVSTPAPAPAERSPREGRSLAQGAIGPWPAGLASEP